MLSNFNQSQNYYFDMIVKLVDSPSIIGNNRTYKLCIISDNNRVKSDLLINKILTTKLSNIIGFNYFININRILLSFIQNTDNTVSISIDNRVLSNNIISVTSDKLTLFNNIRNTFYKSLIFTNNFVMFSYS